ncbi:ATP-binding protein, partial [Serratia marcescens]|uniref:ATP-binding protein n=1 Tax=Serratia marcescens TaxID=615 RepID=UPI001954AAFB
LAPSSIALAMGSVFRKISRSLNIPFRNVQRYTECMKNAYLIFFVKALSPKLSEMAKYDKLE